jgi:hypothetical protein
VQSVTIAPLTVQENDCVPIEQPNIPPPPWGTFARSCSDPESRPKCTGFDEVCAPAVPGPGFKQCVVLRGDVFGVKCPPGYPDRNVFYDEFVDNRYCTPCTCGAPKDGTCVGSLGLFSDPSCNVSFIGPTISIDATGPVCVDAKPTGSALGSKSASQPTYMPGTCDRTGGDEGQIDGTNVQLVCCQDTP